MSLTKIGAMFGTASADGVTLEISSGAMRAKDGGMTPAKMAAGNTGVFNYTAKTTTYAAVIGDLVNCTSGTFTVTLPTAASVSGQRIVIKNNGTGTITVATTSAQTIDALSSGNGFTILPGDGFTYVSTGSNWITI